MKIFINSGYFHHMNKVALDEMISFLGWTKVGSINDANLVYSPSTYLNAEAYPNKKFIFGPHFSVFPNNLARSLRTNYNNAIYIQPSQPSVDTWVNEFNFNNIPVKEQPFAVNLNNYQVSDEVKDTVLLYYKERDPKELEIVKNFMNSKGIKYDLINYGNYNESDYQNKLNRSKYVIWLGRHESQGFALQTVLAKNIPILVWGVTLRKQQHNCPREYHDVKSVVSTVPYWSDECGELFFESSELEGKYNTFIKKLGDYTPRNFIKNNVSIAASANRFKDLVNGI